MIPALVAEALASDAEAQCFVGQPVDSQLLRRAVELEDPSETTSRSGPSGTAARIAFYCDDYAVGRPLLQEVIQRGRENGEQYEVGGLLFELSILEWHAGNVEIAETLQTASRELPQDDDGLWQAYGEALFAGRRGDVEHAREAAARAIAIAQAANDVLLEALTIMVLATLDLWAGQPATAHDRLHPVRTSFTATGFGFLGALTLDLWALDIEALISMTRLDEAQALADDLSQRARTAANPNAIAVAERCQGLVLAARGELPAALTRMEAALAAHEQRLLRPEQARTLLEHGCLLRR